MPVRRYVFGPVYSRRLGVSLGVNNIPYKLCSYSCIYCQLGRTIKLSVERRPYSDPGKILEEVRAALEETGRVDYVTFVPDGEPTLDTMLGDALRLLGRELGVKTAVLTNASLLWMEAVRRSLGESTTVSVKIDAVTEAVWRAVNRPHPSLSLERVLEGVRLFAEEYSGRLISETMLVRGVNDSEDELRRIAEFIAVLGVEKAYIMVPTRPPAEEWVEPPPLEKLVTLHEALREQGVEAELLYSSEPPPPAEPLDPVAYIAATIKVHPLPLDHVEEVLRRRGVDVEEALAELMKLPGVAMVDYQGRRYLAYRPAVPPRPRGSGD